EDLSVREHPGMHRYAPVQGRRDLLDAIATRTEARTGTATGIDNVLVTAGATGALGAVVGALVEPGDEVLLLAPYWPLIAGIVSSFRAHPISVPFFRGVDSPVDSPETAVEAVRRFKSDRTVALYLSTPNNPSGRVMPRRWIEALVAWAQSENLWILADDVYEDYVFTGEHVYTRPFAPESTFSIHSFSKAYGMAGNRCGYAVGPADLMSEVRKVSTHTFYSTPTAAQIAALNAMEGPGQQWIDAAREQYRQTGRRAAKRLGVEPPEGSTFLFLDLAEVLDEGDLESFLSKAVDHGLLAAPGPSFGPYPTHIRICYTAAPPDVTLRGVEVLADLLEKR
ncbi:MAG: pyridoxal phosphate-dependent aminotransferase, partial [Acidobacteriota bacterium]|nr:pyridoxal phosphate-dependent aminotransferase [Acidobacteriota bacterium]